MDFLDDRVGLTSIGVALNKFEFRVSRASASGGGVEMLWYQGDDDEEEDLLYSPALLARRASESWIDTPPIEVRHCRL